MLPILFRYNISTFIKEYAIFMKHFLSLLLPAGIMIFLSACAAFTSGEIKLDRDIAVDMVSDHEKKVYSEIKVSWENFPYRSGTDKIGTGEIDEGTGEFKQQEIKPETADPADQQKLLELAKKIFKKAGLYDRNKGKDTLQLYLQTINRWDYGTLLNTFFVETPFILILPRSLPTGYMLMADIETATSTAHIELAATNKTYFFLPLAPLYPLLSPSRGEKKILNQIFWRMATEIYEEQRKALKAIKSDPGLLKKIQAEKEAKAAKLRKEAEEAAKKAAEAEAAANAENESFGITASEQLEKDNAADSGRQSQAEKENNASAKQPDKDTDKSAAKASSSESSKQEQDAILQDNSALPNDFTPTVVMTND